MIHMIGVDKEVPLFRRSAALVKLVLPTVYSYRLVCKRPKLAGGYVMRVSDLGGSFWEERDN
jgi:hypothetical protein